MRIKWVENNGLFKYFFFSAAVIIAASTLFISNYLVKDLANEERKKMELWAEATRQLAQSAEDGNMGIILKILQDNTTIPIILCDKQGNILSHTNIDLSADVQKDELQSKLQAFRKRHKPIVIAEQDGSIEQYIYYDDSYTLKRLQLYPYVQLGVLTIFIFISFLAFHNSKKAEQNKVWIGLSKETAHQLGTPISSLMAWMEYFKMKGVELNLVSEMEKDVTRLQMITDRFSKIGSTPELVPSNLPEILQNTLDYLSKRISKKVTFHYRPDGTVTALINEPLFAWVIENLTKNAVDAMEGKGDIYYKAWQDENVVYLEVSDTGKGIPKSKFKTVFSPGFTTKSHGWGLGLSLAKRIIESYHKGRIYVKTSEVGKGTTFRVELRKARKATTAS